MESADRVRVRFFRLTLSGLVAFSAILLLLSLLSATLTAATGSAPVSSAPYANTSDTSEDLLSTSPTAAIGQAQAGAVPCLDTSNTLEDLASCIWGYMPHTYSGDGRDGFDVPSVTEMAQWREVVGQMMGGECDAISLSGYGWGDDFTVTSFTDTLDSNAYCVFMETRYETFTTTEVITRVTHGWGTFIYNPAYLRELNVSAPHAKYETDTAVEAVGIFKNTQGRTFLMTGAHRYASDVDSSCQSSCKRSDAAHNTLHMFHTTLAELVKYYDGHSADFYHLQFHGMGASSCPGVDVFLTHGSSIMPSVGDRILELQSNLVNHNPTWTVTVPGDSQPCSLYGSTNVQGRLLNGVAAGNVCTTAASGYSGRFIHLEQKADCRSASDWIDAINETWPPRLSVTKQASSDPVSAGAQLTYTLHVTNTGDTLLHPIVSDTLPAHVTPEGTLTWIPTVIAPGGVWTQTVVVTVEVDHTGPLTNVVQVTTEEGAAGAYTHTVTIVPTVAFNSANYGVDESAGQAAITVTLSGAAALTATVDYVTSDATAKAGEDYTAASGTLTFTPSIAAQTFTIPITDDALDENDETLLLTLSDPVSAALGTPNTATLTINDDEHFVYLPLVARNHPKVVSVTGVICRVDELDLTGSKIWLPQKLIEAYFAPLDITPPFFAGVQPVHPQTGTLIGQRVYLQVDSYDGSTGMADWVVCDLTMKREVRLALCGGDPECDLDEIAYTPIGERANNRALDRTLQFVIEDEQPPLGLADSDLPEPRATGDAALSCLE